MSEHLPSSSPAIEPELRFEVDWLVTDGVADPESASYGALTLRAGESVFTSVLDTIARTTRSAIRVSLHQLALWFADNWWRLRWEPQPADAPSLGWRMAHEMGAIGGGFVWPSISFASDSTQVHIVARASRCEHTIRYLSDHDLVCPASTFERGVDDFVSQVLARQLGCGFSEGQLHDTWNAVREERADPVSAAFRKREAMMGLDPGEIEQDELTRLFAKGEWIGRGALDETLVGVQPPDADELLTTLNTLRQQQRPHLSYQAVLDAVSSWTPNPTDTTPWRRAAALASHLRREWQLGNEPITDAFLDDTLGGDIHSQQLGVSGTPPFVAFRDGAQLRPVLRRTRFRANRRFDIARLIADAAIAEPTDALSPLTRTTTARQKFQRSAAQELLCPIVGLVEHLSLPRPDEEELADAAQHYGVSELLITTALVNHDLVPREYLTS